MVADRIGRRRHFVPAVGTSSPRLLNVGGGHRIHFEQSGNPDGFSSAVHSWRPGKPVAPGSSPLFRCRLLSHRAVRSAWVRPEHAGGLACRKTTSPWWPISETAPAHRRGSMADFRRLMGEYAGLGLMPSRMQIGLPGWCCVACFSVVPPKSNGIFREFGAYPRGLG